MIPEFLVIGAPRSGTTSLARSLASHPDVFVPARKELSFFDCNWDRGLAWFRAHFEDARDGQLRGEATPDYFASELAADRIAATNARCKLIAVVRDPIARAHSHYWFRWNTGRERRSIEEVIADELRAPERGYLLRHGLYARHLRAYRARFGAGAVRVVLFDELVAAPDVALHDCLRFLALDARDLALERDNSARAPRSLAVVRALFGSRDNWARRALRRALAEPRRHALRGAVYRALSRPAANPPLPDTTRAQLHAVFRDDVADLRAALGRQLPWLPASK